MISGGGGHSADEIVRITDTAFVVLVEEKVPHLREPPASGFEPTNEPIAQLCNRRLGVGAIADQKLISPALRDRRQSSLNLWDARFLVAIVQTKPLPSGPKFRGKFRRPPAPPSKGF